MVVTCSQTLNPWRGSRTLNPLEGVAQKRRSAEVVVLFISHLAHASSRSQTRQERGLRGLARLA